MKKRNLLSLLLIGMLIFTVFIVVACVNDNLGDDGDENPPSISMLIPNGTFHNATESSASYLKTNVASWTRTNAATNFNNARMGVVDFTKSQFDTRFGAIYNKASNPLVWPGFAPSTPLDDESESGYEDTNVAFMAIGATDDKDGSVYYRTTSSISLQANKYYKLSIDVCTFLDGTQNDLQGAYIVINGGLYVEFSAIDTAGVWETFDIYIESNNFESRSIYVELWLGHGPEYLGTRNNNDPESNRNPRLTKGIVFFDNVMLKDLTEEIGKDPAKQEYLHNREINGEGWFTNERYAVETLIFPDKGFRYETKYSFISPSSTTSQNYYTAKQGSANNYSMTVGTEGAVTRSDFPNYDSTGSTQGIFNMDKFYKPNADKEKDPIDWFKSINSNFNAPDFDDFFILNADGSITYRRKGLENQENLLNDNRALLVYHPNYAVSALQYKSNHQFLIEKGLYYKISAWAYVWIPEYGIEFKETAPVEPAVVAEPVKPDEDDPDYDELMEQYNKDKASYDAYVVAKDKYDTDLRTFTERETRHNQARDRYYETASTTSAEFRISGASIEKENPINAKTTPFERNIYDNDGEIVGWDSSGRWELLTIYVKGNELSDRRVNFEFWFGDGEWTAEASRMAVGGAIFDNLIIEVATHSELSQAERDNYTTLSPIAKANIEELRKFGLLGALDNDADTEALRNALQDKEDSDWLFEFIDEQFNKEVNQNASKELAEAKLIHGEFASTLADNDDDTAWKALFPNLPKPGTHTIAVEGQDELFNLLMLHNKQATATKLSYDRWNDDNNPGGDMEKEYLEILPNTFYRLSMWIRTDLIPSGKGLNVFLYDEDDNTLTSLSRINTDGEWTEVSFFIRGGIFTAKNAYLVFQLGEGDAFSPTGHAEGVAYITALTFMSIAWSEFNSSSSGAHTSKYTVSDSPSTSGTVSNGKFADINTSNFEKRDELFNDKGQLTGVAVPTSWTSSAPINGMTAPTNLVIRETSNGSGVWELSWRGVTGATAYYIFLDGAEWLEEIDSEKPVKKNDVLVGIVEIPHDADDDIKDNPVWQTKYYGVGHYKVRSVNNPNAGTGAEDSNQALGISAPSSTISNASRGETKNSPIYNDEVYTSPALNISLDKLKEDKVFAMPSLLMDETKELLELKAEMGVIDYRYYKDLTKKLGLADDYFPDNEDFPRIEFFDPNFRTNPSFSYVSPDNHMLMLSSNYYTRGGFTASTSTLSANTYYRMSVWVLTTPGTRASITVNNTSRIFSTSEQALQDRQDPSRAGQGDYNGFVNVDTNGEWVQYVFYMRTSISSATVQLELWLGNKYAENHKDGDRTISKGLSMGTAFFTGVSFSTINEDDYNNFLFGGNPEEDDTLEMRAHGEFEEREISELGGANIWTNSYFFMPLDYTT
ncbi:MAG: hypothetical protein FWD49_02395, partial [Firmicutes bacterium]|nr:hypothetical protein [Bacillota bacterium]